MKPLSFNYDDFLKVKEENEKLRRALKEMCYRDKTFCDEWCTQEHCDTCDSSLSGWVFGNII